MARASKGTQHKAKPTHKGRKYSRNRVARSAGNPTKYRASGARERNKARRAAKRARAYARRAAKRLAQGFVLV